METRLFDNLQRQIPFRWLKNRIKDAGGDKIDVGLSESTSSVHLRPLMRLSDTGDRDGRTASSGRTKNYLCPWSHRTTS